MKTGSKIVQIFRALAAWRPDACACLASVVIMLASLGVSCQQIEKIPPIERKTQNDNVLRYDVNAPFTSLNPTVVEASGSTHVFPLLYSFLFVPDTRGKLQSDLAVSWPADPDYRVWTIHLRKGVLFHNGRPVTSRDVEYSLSMHLANGKRHLSSLVGRVSVLSDTALRVELTRGDPLFPQKIWDCEIVPELRSGQTEYDNRPVGSGPFKFASRRGGDELVLVANEDYYAGRPCLDGVVFSFQPDKEKSWARLLSGETDIAVEISPRNYQMTKQYEQGFHFERYTIGYCTILLYNTNDFLFCDPKVRLALSYAIDREHIVENILGGSGVVAVGPMGVESPYRNPALKPVPYDPKEGARLLREAGWLPKRNGDCLTRNGRPFEFSILVFTESQAEKRVAEYIRLCLNDVGIRARVRCLPHGEVVRRYLGKDDFQAVITEFNTTGRAPEYVRKTWCRCQREKSDAGGFHDPHVARLIDEALGEEDQARRVRLFHEIDATIAALQPATFLFQKTAANVMSRRFALPGPFSLAYEGIYRLKYASLKAQ